MDKKVERTTTPISRIMRLETRSGQHGMTLIEIIITVAIIGLIMGLSLGIFRDYDEAALEETADRLVGTIKYVYNEAAIKNQYYRLVINFEDQSFAVEASSEPFKISATQEGVPETNQSTAANIEEVGASLENDKAEEEETAEEPSLPSEAKFSGTSSYLLKPIQLPSGIRIKDVFVAHLDKKVEAGKTSIYFFPNGWVEKAVINLTDEGGDNFYSIETFSNTGKAKIRTEYLDYKAEEGEK